MKNISKKMKVIMGVVLAAVIIMVGVGVYTANSHSGDLTAEAPRRAQGDINANGIADEPVPLSDMDPALLAASKSAFDLVNQQRTAAGLKALVWNDDLSNCAGVRAKEAATTWSHTRPNGSDWYTVNSAIMGGENLARGYSTAQDALNAWMASATHKDNILYPDFTKAGIAIYNDNGYWYWAQEFGY